MRKLLVLLVSVLFMSCETEEVNLEYCYCGIVKDFTIIEYIDINNDNQLDNEDWILNSNYETEGSVYDLLNTVWTNGTLVTRYHLKEVSIEFNCNNTYAQTVDSDILDITPLFSVNKNVCLKN